VYYSAYDKSQLLVVLWFNVVDIVNLDIKSTLRVLYNLFTKYKNIS